MMELVYTKEKRGMFSGRSYFLNQINKSIEKGKNLALLGPRFIGKSTIVKEFISNSDHKSCYIDFEKTSMSPERFAVEFVGGVCFWFLSKKYNEFSDFQKIDGLKRTSSELNSKGAAAIIDEIDNELAKIKPDQNLLVTKALAFPQVLSKETGEKLVVCIKEFQSIFSLENYEGIKDVMSLFNESLGGVNYIVTSSEVNSSKDKFVGFDFEEVGGLSKEEVGELLGKLKSKADPNLVFKVVGGHPLYSSVVCEGDVEKNFVSSVLVKNGVLYNSCKEIFYQSLNKARGQTLLMIIMKVLASEGSLRLSEVSKKIYRSSPITKNLLTRLMMVDLVKMEDKRFAIADPVLKFWIKNVFNGLEFEGSVDEKVLGELVKEL